MQFLPDSLSPLAAYPQFVLYKIIPSTTRPGKTDKIPIDPRSGRNINPHQLQSWLSVSEAIQAATLWGDNHGVGFVFTDADPFWFLDIDECLLDNGWSPLAQSLMTLLTGAAIEISSSRRGLHIFGTGICPSHSCRNKPLGLEFYNTLRFVALTGDSVVGNASYDCSSVLPQLIQTYFPLGAAPVSGDLMQRWSESYAQGPVEQWRGPTEDTILIARMLRSGNAESAFGDGIRFADLWDANSARLAEKYDNDDSAIDAALAQHLAWWTGNDAGRMHRLMLQSKLAREKWNRTDYLPRTILNACALRNTWLQDPLPAVLDIPPPLPDAACGKLITGNTHLSPQDQLNHFKGCVLVSDAHRVLVPGGHLLRPEQFKAKYGHRTFAMDYMNEKVSRDAWEAFTQSRAYEPETADSICFRPQEKPGAVIPENGTTLANVWWPVIVKRAAGDIGPFIKHLEKLIVNAYDRQILLAYFAACVQHAGIKFQWAPFIQGTQGNGKTVLTRCVAQAIGLRYVSFPKATQLDGKFNLWMRHKLLIGVEDIYVPYGQLEIIEALKPMITNETQPIEPKGVDMQTEEVCCNFIINSNHKDGLPKSYDDRRFAPFFTAQQEPEHCKRDGITSEYLFQLYDWLRKKNGYAVVSEFLHTYSIPDELNPAHGRKAPETSTTFEAIEHGRGAIEQEILEQIEQGAQGFRGGWISSMALNRLLTQQRADRRISLAKRGDLLRSLGYDLHPGLTRGRVNNDVQPDGGKPQLYIRRGHPAFGLLSPVEIARAYTEAQQYA